MSHIHTSFLKLFKNGLSYRKYSFLKGNVSFFTTPSILQVNSSCLHIPSCHHYSERKDLGGRPRINKKLHNRVLTDEEIEEDRKLSEYVNNIAEDEFGNIRKEHVAQKQNEFIKDENSKFYNDDRDDRWNGKHTDKQRQYFGKIKSSQHNKQGNAGRNMKKIDKYMYSKQGPEQSTNGSDQLDIKERHSHPKRSKPKEWESTENTENKGWNDKPGRKTWERKDKWSETFGTLSAEEDTAWHKEDDDIENTEENIKPHIRLSKTDRRNDPHYYVTKITDFGKKGKIKEAIEVFDIWMLDKDRVMPDKYVISSLLTVLAKAGYTQKAFKVFNKAKKLGIEPNDYMYSALFNACANSPWPEDGLKRAKLLLQEIGFRNVTPNSVLFNTMVKAFAVCGDPRTAFLIADQQTDYVKLDEKAFGHVLMAAVSDKTAGFWFAVQVWRWMLLKRIKPNVKMYNLLLRVTKECDIGNPILSQQLLLPINPATTMKLFKGENASNKYGSEFLHVDRKDMDLKQNAFNTTVPIPLKDTKSQSGDELLASPSNKSVTEQQIVVNVDSEIIVNSTAKSQLNLDIGDNAEVASHSKDNSDLMFGVVESSELVSKNAVVLNTGSSAISTDNIMKLPNILNPKEDLSHVISVRDIKTPETRFMMIGGINGFLSDMERNGVQPDLLTFDQMLSLIPANLEQQLLDIMESKGVKPDIDFLSSLAYKRCLRLDTKSARAVIDLIAYHKLVPNMRTYGVLAGTCISQHDGMQLIQNMKAAGLVPTIQVMGALVRASYTNFPYKRALLEVMEDIGLKPNHKLIQTIEKHIKVARNVLLIMEKNDVTTNRYKELDKNYADFKNFYRSWLKKMEMDVPEHPWASFREEKAAQAE